MNVVEVDRVAPPTETPAVCHFAAVSLHCSKRIAVHGGCTDARSNRTTSAVHYYDCVKQVWFEGSTRGPALSHHAAFQHGTHESLWYVVGGSNGRIRTGDVWQHDERDRDPWTRLGVRGFPEGGGLSSHTVTPMADPAAALVVGRLGGTRQQRRNAEALLLNVSPSDAEYSPLRLPVSSRSGHTATVLSSREVMVIGGREERTLDVELVTTEERLRPATKASIKMKRSRDANPKKVLATRAARRWHSTLMDSRSNVLILGGIGFSGLEKTALQDDYMIAGDGRWESLRVTERQTGRPVHLFGHSVVVCDSVGYIIGGCRSTNGHAESAIYAIE